MSTEEWIEIVLAAWLLLLSVSILGLGRQVADLFVAIRTGKTPKTGERLLLHAPVASDILEALARANSSTTGVSDSTEEQIVVHLSASCGGCPQAAQSLVEAAVHGTGLSKHILASTTCLITGADGHKDRLLKILEEVQVPIIEDPQASVMARRLGLFITPFALAIHNGEVSGWADMTDFLNLERLLLQNRTNQMTNMGSSEMNMESTAK